MYPSQVQRSSTQTSTALRPLATVAVTEVWSRWEVRTFVRSHVATKTKPPQSGRVDAAAWTIALHDLNSDSVFEVPARKGHATNEQAQPSTAHFGRRRR